MEGREGAKKKSENRVEWSEEEKRATATPPFRTAKQLRRRCSVQGGAMKKGTEKERGRATLLFYTRGLLGVHLGEPNRSPRNKASDPPCLRVWSEPLEEGGACLEQRVIKTTFYSVPFDLSSRDTLIRALSALDTATTLGSSRLFSPSITRRLQVQLNP